MTNKKINPKPSIKSTAKDHSSNPFIEQKIANSKKAISKYGIPKEIANRQQ
jgi:hypothetical protein